MRFLGPLGRAKILQPLRHRDFALLTGGSTVSLLGDGFFFLALAWQVYEISNVPTALSVVWVAWTLPSVIFLLVDGNLREPSSRCPLPTGRWRATVGRPRVA